MNKKSFPDDEYDERLILHILLTISFFVLPSYVFQKFQL